MRNSLLYALLFILGCSGLFAQVSQTIVENHLENFIEEGALSTGDIAFEITNEHVSSLSGIRHIYYRQTVQGIPLIGTASALHLQKEEIFAQDNNFINDVTLKITHVIPSISARDAILTAAQEEQYLVSSTLVQINKTITENKYVFSDGGISLSNIPVSLSYKRTESGVHLVWEISIQEKTQKHWYNLFVDAHTGVVLSKFDWMTQCNLEHSHKETEVLDFNENLVAFPNKETGNTIEQGCTECYEVFAMPLSSPYFGPRTIENFPSNEDASPFGWHDTNGVAGAEFTTTRGNNVNAYEDGDNVGYQPDGDVNLDFTGYLFNQNYSPFTQFENAAITNLFYWNNTIHDVMYQYGFDPKSGNFQENNYNQGGVGDDSVNAEAQDNSGTCNANFGTPPEGINPRMQMYTCEDKDGDFDALVITHEYAHGISNRLTGGAANVQCLYGNEQMGEGWSDYFGLMLTMTENDMAGDAKGIGTYLFGQGPNGDGIRSFPYSTDLSINPQTYDDIKTESIPHGVGSVWASMLWEMTWELINAHGFSDDFYTVTGDVNQDAGNIQAMLLVMEALKLQPCAPGFVDGRDAILAADVAIYGGENECLIWEAFAKRGLGFSAIQGSTASRVDGIQAFDTPSTIANFTAFDDVCLSSFVITNATGGIPFGGFYSGPGVTDNGDGYSYTFDPEMAGIGVHTIVYEIEDGACAVASIASDTVEVLFAPDAPSTTDALLVCLNEDVTVTATLNNPSNVVNWYDAIVGGNLIGSGTSMTFVPTEDITIYAQEGPLLPEGELKITEISLLAPDIFEITNIGAARDYTGYKVALSDVPFNDINAVNIIVRELDFMTENSVIYFDDLSQSPNYWGSNISWAASGHGWIIILDPNNNVVESVFWNASSNEINTLDIDIDGVTIDVTDIEWTGIGANFSIPCNNSFRRVGENDTASNWNSSGLSYCLYSDFGAYNTDMQLGFQGCLPQRVPSVITGEEEIPVITCPEDMMITQSAEVFEMPDFTTDAIATDNCTFTITQIPEIGSLVPEGNYTVTLTVIDGSGNSSMCSFEINAILGVDDLILDAQVTLVPNPTFGNMTLTYHGDISLTEIALIDVHGRMIKKMEPSTTAITNFSISEIAAGFYFLKIIAGANILVKQIIKR